MNRVSTRLFLVIFSVVFLTGLAVRIWGIDWGLPYAYHADEPVNLSRTWEMVKRGDLDPGVYNYPPLFYYVEAGGQLAYYSVGAANGSFTSVQDVSTPHIQTLGNGRLDNPNTLLTGRLLSVAFSLAAVALVMILAFGLTRDPLAVGISGAAIAIGPLGVRQARFLTPDALGTMFVVVVIVASLAILRSNRTLWYAVAGAGVGMAAATKYHLAIAAVAVVIAHVLHAGRHWHRRHGIYLAGGVAIGVFVLLSVPLLLNFDAFTSEFAWKSGAYASGNRAVLASLSFYAVQLVREYGWLILLAPVPLVAGRHRREALVLATFTVSYVVLVSWFVLRYSRHALPVTPSLAVLIGLGAYVTLEWLADRVRRWPSRRILATSVIVAGLLVPLAGTIRDGSRYSSDERAAARAVIDAQDDGSRFLVDAYSAFVDPARYDVLPTAFVLTDPTSPSEVDFVTVTEQGSGRLLGDAADPWADPLFLSRFAGMCEVFVDEGPPWQWVLAWDCSG